MSKKVMHIFTPIGDGRSGIIQYDKKEVEKCPSLHELQEMVADGGLIELVRVNYNGKECDMIIDESGLCKNKPFNIAATKFMQETYDGYGHIVGTAIIFDGFKLP